jgi:hypothetical protein
LLASTFVNDSGKFCKRGGTSPLLYSYQVIYPVGFDGIGDVRPCQHQPTSSRQRKVRRSTGRSRRRVEYRWRLPTPAPASKSIEGSLAPLRQPEIFHPVWSQRQSGAHSNRKGEHRKPRHHFPNAGFIKGWSPSGLERRSVARSSGGNHTRVSTRGKGGGLACTVYKGDRASQSRLAAR